MSVESRWNALEQAKARERNDLLRAIEAASEQHRREQRRIRTLSILVVTFHVMLGCALVYCLLLLIGCSGPTGRIARGLGDCVPSGHQLRVMPLGDSRTYGGSLTPYPNPAANSYRGRLYQVLTLAGYSVTFVGPVHGGDGTYPDASAGRPGWRWYDFLVLSSAATLDNEILNTYGNPGYISPGQRYASESRCYKWAEVYQPDLVLFDLDWNDDAQSTTPYQVATRMMQCLSEVHEAAPYASFLVHDPLPVHGTYSCGKTTVCCGICDSPGGGPAEAQARLVRYHDDLGDAIAYLIARGMTVYRVANDEGVSPKLEDPQDTMLPQFGGWPGATGGDGLHLNSFGYQRWGDNWSYAVQVHFPLCLPTDGGAG
jgi:hypothetical protein